jgi:Rod binding domain-containing protein
MSISPPSDIVLDVVRAADPVRYQVAADRLTRMSSATPAEPFSETLDSFAPAARPPSSPAPAMPRAGPDPAVAARKAYEGFEAMTLQTFIEAAMPGDDSPVFGSGTAGSVWKSMLSEQIANQMAKSGGIGIARELAAHALSAMKAPEAGDIAPSVLANTERGFLRTIDPDRGNLIDKTSS